MSVTALSAHGVSLQYGSQMILDDVTLDIPVGTYVGIVGPNGGGKTTFIKIVLGLLQPTSGHIDVFGMSPRQARQNGAIGYVPQRVGQEAFKFPATVEEVVRSGLLRGQSESDVSRALAATDVENLRGQLLHTLSGGQRQRVFIARAIVSKPKMLVLDEPATGVDPESRDQFYALLRKLNAEYGITILFVSHDIDVMTREADSIASLNQKLLCFCSSKEFAANHMYGEHVSHSHTHSHAHS